MEVGPRRPRDLTCVAQNYGAREHDSPVVSFSCLRRCLNRSASDIMTWAAASASLAARVPDPDGGRRGIATSTG